MWTVVYLAQSNDVAERLQAGLIEGGLLVSIRTVESGAGSEDYFEIMVPEHEVEKAHNIIIEKNL